jgi:exodeoxyribonuclease VII small subunit
MENKITPIDFEDAIINLENIVKKIENDEIKLDDALEQYQQGIQLIKFCQEKLKNVEQKIKILETSEDKLEDFNVG